MTLFLLVTIGCVGSSLFGNTEVSSWKRPERRTVWDLACLCLSGGSQVWVSTRMTAGLLKHSLSGHNGQISRDPVSEFSTASLWSHRGEPSGCAVKTKSTHPLSYAHSLSLPPRPWISLALSTSSKYFHVCYHFHLPTLLSDEGRAITTDHTLLKDEKAGPGRLGDTCQTMWVVGGRADRVQSICPHERLPLHSVPFPPDALGTQLPWPGFDFPA